MCCGPSHLLPPILCIQTEDDLQKHLKAQVKPSSQFLCTICGGRGHLGFVCVRRSILKPAVDSILFPLLLLFSFS